MNTVCSSLLDDPEAVTGVIPTFTSVRVISSPALLAVELLAFVNVEPFAGLAFAEVIDEGEEEEEEEAPPCFMVLC